MIDALPFDYPPVMIVQGQIGAGRRDIGDIAIVIDSGAAGPFPVFISTRLGKKLKLVQSAEVVPPPGSSIGANAPGYRAARVDRFSLGPIALTAVPVAVTPVLEGLSANIGRRIDAIVGATFLHPLTVAIDFPAQTIDLTAQPGPAAAAQKLRFAPAKPLILVTATVNGAGPFTMELDTGASITSLSPGAAKRAGVAITGQNLLTGAGGTITIGTGSATVTSGGVTRKLANVSITAAIDDIARTAGTPIDGIIGLDWLHRTQVIIDGPGQRWWVTRAPA